MAALPRMCTRLTCDISSRMARPTWFRSSTSTRCSKHARESKRIGAWEARPYTTSKPPSSVHRALVCTKRAGDTMSLSVQRPCCKAGKANVFFAWLLMWVNCPISIPHVEGALYVYVKPKDIFVDQALLRFQAEALDERVHSAGPQALQSHKRCRASRHAA